MTFRELMLKSYKSNEEIIKFGENGTEFFMILKGTVSVRVPTNVICDSKEEFIEMILRHYDEGIIWKSVENAENVKFHIEAIRREKGTTVFEKFTAALLKKVDKEYQKHFDNE